MKKIKLNVGASPIWDKDGWHTLDHKPRENSENSILGDAGNIPIESAACSVIFCSHMFEHIPHTRLENILLEFNRVLDANGILRILTPDLKKIAKAYADDDHEFFALARREDENIRTDLGLGGMFMNFVVSPGQDTALFNRQLNEFISGYAHIYLYDFQMLKILLERCGFNDVRHVAFGESDNVDLREPLHVTGFEPKWQNFNKEFYDKHNLVHFYDEKTGRYNINFRVTGFDRDPLTSLIVECRKDRCIDKTIYSGLNLSSQNYNRYGQSLMKDETFRKKVQSLAAN
jgi:hypothetical protein